MWLKPEEKLRVQSALTCIDTSHCRTMISIFPNVSIRTMTGWPVGSAMSPILGSRWGQVLEEGNKVQHAYPAECSCFEVFSPA